MGLDGGTYITRSDVLRGQSWALAQADNSRSTRGGDASKLRKTQPTVERQVDRSNKWSTCTLSGQPLQEPIVVDMLGNLYNRDAVLEFLLAKLGAFQDEAAQHRYLNQQKASNFGYDHLSTIKDVFTLHLTRTQDTADAARVDDKLAAPFVCPLTEVPCTQYPFSALLPCGHAFSDRAIKQITDGNCPLCGSAVMEQLPVNGTAEQVAALQLSLETRQRALQEHQRRRKKRKTAGSEPGPAAKPGASSLQECTSAKLQRVA